MCKQCRVTFTHPLYFSHLGEAVIHRYKTNICCSDERPFSFRAVLNHTSQSTLLLCSYIMSRPVIDHTVYQDADALVHIYCIKQVHTTIPLLLLYTTSTIRCPLFQTAQRGSHRNYLSLFTTMTAPVMLISCALAEKSTLR